MINLGVRLRLICYLIQLWLTQGDFLASESLIDNLLIVLVIVLVITLINDLLILAQTNRIFTQGLKSKI